MHHGLEDLTENVEDHQLTAGKKQRKEIEMIKFTISHLSHNLPFYHISLTSYRLI